MSAPVDDHAPPKARGSKLGLVVSLLAPGFGHGAVGRGRRGAIWLAGLFGLWLVGCLISAYWMGALLVTGALTALWYAGCAWDAYRAEPAKQALRPWLELAGATVVVGMIAPVLIAALIRGLTLEAFKVAGESMCPTLETNDQLFVDKTAYRTGAPSRGDVVVYSNTLAGGAKADFVHRVVALEGDEIAVEGGRVTLNGEAVATTSTPDAACGGSVFDEKLGAPHHVAIGTNPSAKVTRLRVPEGHVFLLGDNRDNAADSRSTGTVPVSAIRGRAWKLISRGDAVRWTTIE
ncbi:MAG: signal peptidase I [Myxococcales bacterium]|nr:signal peptidase I [Myxococcales bacterium]MCB9576339.1 signal peptidase I [Polyangiaceae bacterium]